MKQSTWDLNLKSLFLTISSCVSVRMSRYCAHGKFGEHERDVRVARGAAFWVGRRLRRIAKLTRTRGVVYWRHQLAQWEYEARLRYWIWLGEYSSFVIIQIYLNNGCSLELIIASRTIYLFLPQKTASVLICFCYARLSSSTRTTTSHDLHVLLLTLYFPFTKRNPRKFSFKAAENASFFMMA